MSDLQISRRATGFVGGFIAAVIFSLNLNQSAWAASPKSGWSIDSNSNMMGSVTCKFNDDAAYMRLDKMGLVIISSAPKWNMLVYNDVNKNCMKMTFEQWQKRFGAGMLGKSSKKEPMKTVTTKKREKILGFSADQILLKGKVNGVEQTRMEVWLSTAISAPMQLKSLFRTFLNLPEDMHGMPLRVLTLQNGKLVPMLEAYKVTKATLAKETFQPLTGYKEVKDEMALMMDDGDSSSADDLLGTKPVGKVIPGTTPGAVPGKAAMPAAGVGKATAPAATPGKAGSPAATSGKSLPPGAR
jgi:hypothetical protein